MPWPMARTPPSPGAAVFSSQRAPLSLSSASSNLGKYRGASDPRTFGVVRPSPEAYCSILSQEMPAQQAQKSNTRGVHHLESPAMGQPCNEKNFRTCYISRTQTREGNILLGGGRLIEHGA